MIEGIFGLPGKGKTYEGVRRLLELADLGIQCFSVTPIKHPNVEHVTYEDILCPYMPPGTILLDEVHLRLSSAISRQLDPAWFERLSQTRKDGHNLIYTSQHESKVLKQLRDNTNYGWLTEAWLPMRGHPTWFTARCWEMHKLRKGKPIDRYSQLFSRRIADAYDTRFAIKAELAVAEKADSRNSGFAGVTS